MKEEIREIFLNLGASVCGIGNIEDFKNIPEGFSPKDILKECKSVIAFGINLPKGLTKIDSSIIYGHFNYLICSDIDKIAMKAATILEEKYDCIALPMPSDDPYIYWDKEKLEGKGLISMKHTAVLCGLGQLGKNTLLLNPKYGNMLVIGAVLTDLDLKSDELSENICRENCNKCRESCPAKAIEDNHVTQMLCRNNAYGKTKKGVDIVQCNICRQICPMKYGK